MAKKSKIETEKMGLSAPASCSTFVRMFKPQFAPLVESGAKLQTVRPTPKRMPKPGDRISLRAWTGKPYRSKQRVLREAVITAVSPIRIFESSMAVGEHQDNWNTRAANKFARADGFPDYESMLEWFRSAHGLPFEGVVIHWANDQEEQSQPGTRSATQGGNGYGKN